MAKIIDRARAEYEGRLIDERLYGKREVAISMIVNGFSDEVITKLTEIPLSDIKELRITQRS